MTNAPPRTDVSLEANHIDASLAAAEMSAAETSGHRRLTRRVGFVVAMVALVMSLFHIWVLGFRPIDPWFLRGGHVLFGAILTFALFPFSRKSPKDRIAPVDYLFMLMVAVPFIYVVVTFEDFIHRVGVIPTTLDFIMALVAIIAILEMARRTTGVALVIIAGIFLLYARVGFLLPGLLYHRGYSWERIFSFAYSLNGVFSVPIAVSVSYVALFILFGAFLQASGGGRYFIELALALAGGSRGGPAKVAVVASALFGTISGSSAGNVVTTGSFTIPMMKRIGYNPRFAGAVEAVASTGGQIMPPIMGAGAFLMAEILGVPYLAVAIAAVIPALLYFFSVFLMVDLEAGKIGLKGLTRSELPPLRRVLMGAYLLLPVVVLIYALVFARVSIIRAGLLGIATCVVVSQINPKTRMGPAKIMDALVSGAKATLNIIGTCAAAGVIVGVIGQTGLGMRMAAILVDYSMGILLLALILSAIAVMILGMGMPTTAAYAIAAAVVAPALIRPPFELMPLQAHMFVFYFACLSAITPPVALAAYAAAPIAKAPAMAVGWMAVKLGITGWVVPAAFILAPALLMVGTADEIGLTLVTTMMGIFALAVFVQGWLGGKLSWPARAIMLAASLLMITPGLVTDLLGIGLIATIGLPRFLKAHRPAGWRQHPTK
ncbi:MAG TPA: C4-dicarboxylate ABC transporter [Dehalococcoidia bacterium]|nr:C4-dicarboxylate ABC transporter [Dehalococcoidia bacterium]